VEGFKIGYIHIWPYTGEQYHRTFLDALSREALRDADALLWDLREGPGGANPEYLNVFNRKVPRLESSGRDGASVLLDVQWRKPVAMLVNRSVRSGKEILAFGFRKYGIGKVIGERTAGAVAGGRPFLLSNGAILFLAVRSVRVDGEILEGIGVSPDIEVPMDIRFLGGRDVQVEKGLDYLAEVLKGKGTDERRKR
jgi:carboxyl-terminal processing protease